MAKDIDPRREATPPSKPPTKTTGGQEMQSKLGSQTQKAWMDIDVGTARCTQSGPDLGADLMDKIVHNTRISMMQNSGSNQVSIRAANTPVAFLMWVSVWRKIPENQGVRRKSWV